VPRGLWSYGIRQIKILTDKAPAVFDDTQLRTGRAGDTALLLADDILVRTTASGELCVGETQQNLGVVAAYDGLACANGRLYLTAHDGRLLCLEPNPRAKAK
jgi:hypothetical protein